MANTLADYLPMAKQPAPVAPKKGAGAKGHPHKNLGGYLHPKKGSMK